LDKMNAGIYLVRPDGRVLFMNQVAERQIKQRRGIVIEKNRLMPKDSAAEAHFYQSLGAENESGSTTVSIALPDENGGLLATVLRLDRGQRQNLNAGSVFAVFVQNPEVAPPIPAEAFATLFGLTPAEHRILLAMAPGLGPQDAADILGLGLSTVKTHLQNIFSKTNTNKQSDLMQLLVRASAPVHLN
jgi:DNA-binding CsgD family transcriptional regulator